MEAKNILQQIGESLGSTATVKSVFGEPIQAEGRVIVPVAKVAYGFGGGFGAGHGKTEAAREGQGGGGGGGVRAYPAGALEISSQGTRFIPFSDRRLLAGTFIAGVLFARIVGGLFFRRRLRA